jgi:hypothetical protein
MAEQFGNNDPGSAVEPCPLQRPKTEWLEIECIGEDGLPVPWIEYRVVLPDGKEVKGYLDGEGYARLEQIAKPGQCKITFPELDEEAWSFIESTGPRPS